MGNMGWSGLKKEFVSILVSYIYICKLKACGFHFLLFFFFLIMHPMMVRMRLIDIFPPSIFRCHWLWNGLWRHRSCDICIWKIVQSKWHLVFNCFNIVTTLPCSTLIFNSLTISVGPNCAATFAIATSLVAKHGFHILTNM